MMGESMDENSAKITVMDKDRRILEAQYTCISLAKAIGFRVAEPAKIVKLFNLYSNGATTFVCHFSATLV